MKHTPEVAWIARIGVLDTERRKGLGSRLMEAMVAHCREIGRRTVILYVMQDNRAALRLYEKYGVEVTEETVQYVASVGAEAVQGEPNASGTLQAVPLLEIPEPLRPEFSAQWTDLPEQHDPPKTWVLVIRTRGGEPVGHCRLVPEFPGCFPFELDRPGDLLEDALVALRPYLSKDHDTLKLTITDPAVTRACDALDIDLNYRLYQMTLRMGDSATVPRAHG